MKAMDLAPAIVIFVGALISAGGAVWASVRQSQSERELKEKNQEIADLNRQIAGSVTGGDSFGYLQFSGSRDSSHPLLIFVHEGAYPLYDVRARMVDLQDFQQRVVSESVTLHDIMQGDTLLDIGSATPGFVNTLGQFQLPARDSADYNVFFTARNGGWNQEIRRRRVSGEWSTATRVRRINSDSTDSEIWSKVDDDYPLNDSGTVDW